MPGGEVIGGRAERDPHARAVRVARTERGPRDSVTDRAGASFPVNASLNGRLKSG
jgi:hypothetical protein